MTKLRLLLMLLLASLAGFGTPCHSVVLADTGGLPRAHEHQRVLCEYLATLGEGDFALPLRRLQFREEQIADEDALCRLWMLLRVGTRSLPAIDGLRLPASSFTLASIEHDGGIRFDTAKVVPEALAWWSTWAHPANPHQGSAAVRARAFVGAAVNLLALEQHHGAGRDLRSDLTGGTLIEAAYTYGKIKEHLPLPVRAAFEVALLRLLERFETWGPTGIHADMDIIALPGMWYLGEAIPTDDVRKRTEAYAHRVLSRHLRAAGYVDHGGGYDPSYNGISLHFMTWLASVASWPFVREGLASMLRLKAHLALPEPSTSLLVGPTHFATTMSEDGASDQWALPWRDLGAAMLLDEGLYLLGPGRRDQPSKWSIPAPLEMRRQVAEQLHAGVNPLLQSPLPALTERWQRRGWPVGLNYAHDHYVPGFYARVRNLRAARSPLLLPPVVRPGVFIRQFADEFVVARFENYAAVLHAGGLSWWEGLSGLSGGAISAVWTPDAGAAWLGRLVCRPYSDRKDPRQDSWAHVERWQTHAVSGRTPAGKAFSTARIRDPVRQIRVEGEGTRASLQFEGALGTEHDRARACEPGCAIGSMRHRGRIDLDARGLRVEHRLQWNAADPVASLWVSLPVFDGHPEIPGRTPPRGDVQCLVSGEWEPVQESWGHAASHVRILRHAGALALALDAPRRLRLSAPGPFGRALMIELAFAAPPPGSQMQDVAMTFEVLPSLGTGRSSEGSDVGQRPEK